MPIDLDHPGRTLIVVAHPDDEAIGAGSVLWRFLDLCVVYVTDGSPEKLGDALRNGLATRQDYADLRRREGLAALAAAGVSNPEVLPLNFPDQQAAHKLIMLVQVVAELIQDARPDLLLTHSYEGGHPDHDAVAFAVHAARHELDQSFTLAEFTSYHAGPDGNFVAEEFLGKSEDLTTICLTDDERDRKRRILDCYQTQQEVLRQFPLRCEHFRIAPRYEFSRKPHPGKPYYEQFDWGITSRAFRSNVTEATSFFGLPNSV